MYFSPTFLFFLCLDADAFIERGEVNFRGHLIRVERIDGSQEEDVPPETTVLLVENVPEQESGESIKLLLENKRMSGGGPIDTIEKIGEGQYIVYFASCEGISYSPLSCSFPYQPLSSFFRCIGGFSTLH